MAVHLNCNVFYPAGFQELFSIWNRLPDAVLYSGGTGLLREQGGRVPNLPQNLICLDRIDELKKISRTERYLEIGAAVKLTQILNLGKIVPEALVCCIKNIEGPPMRNQATLGGNLCNRSQRLDCSCPIVALDAQFELRTAQSARWISASRFFAVPNYPDISPHEIMTRIRVPLEPWRYTWYHKFRNAGNDEACDAILFMIRNQKDILSNIRVVYTGKTILRDKTGESMLEGKRLPLAEKDANVFIESWKNCLYMHEVYDDHAISEKGSGTNPELVKARIMNFIETTIMEITD